MQTFVAYAKGETVEVKADLVVKECRECHMLFAMPAYFEQQAHKQGPNFKGWHCPQGHSSIYIDGEIQKLQKELDAERENVRLERQWKERERVQRIEAERKAANLKKRVASGVCPCCKRSFQNLRKHVAMKHPEVDGATLFEGDRVAK